MNDNNIQELFVRLAKLETILEEIVVPQSKKSVVEWNKLAKLNVEEKLNLIPSVKDGLEELSVRLICIEDNQKQKNLKTENNIKKIEKELLIYKYSFGAVIALGFVLYSKLIIFDPEVAAKYISILAL
tara:strand:- start:21 stop:404 length:384 start_codon:yes stop_codon:yes gene_type:complete